MSAGKFGYLILGMVIGTAGTLAAQAFFPSSVTREIAETEQAIRLAKAKADLAAQEARGKTPLELLEESGALPALKVDK